jgi:asparagine synthase (glutamine-hydrolysing)
LPAVLAGLDDGRAIDETYLAGFLHGLPPRDRTIWSGVERLEPGHRRLVGRDHDVTERYWSPTLTPLVQPLEATIEHLRSSFDEAVRCRLRTRDGVAVDLSGGFDSSTVTVTAAGLTQGVKPISLVYRVDDEAFELPYIEAVADHLGLEAHLIEADELTTLDAVADIRAHQEPLYSVDATDTAACYDAARTLGCSVSLTGMGGDELLYGAPARRRDLVRWSTREPVMRWTSARPDGWVARAARAVRGRNERRERPWLRVPPPPWPEPARRVGSRAAAARLSGYEGAWNAAAYELTDRLAAERGVEVRSPYLDRRLVELGLRLPHEQIRADGVPRGLHRRTFGERLPASVAGRTDKADFSGSFRRRMDGVDHADAVAALAALGDRIDRAALGSGGPSDWDRWVVLSAGLVFSELLRNQI